MPEYRYRCSRCKHEEYHSRGMLDDAIIKCSECGAAMYRRPQLPMVNWNGLKPSQGEISPHIKRHIEYDAPRNRERMQK